MLVNYHLFHIATGTIAGAAAATILNKSRLVGYKINATPTGGAGGGFLSITLEHNNSSQANGETNNPPRQTVLGTHTITIPQTTFVNTSTGFIPFDRPLQVGDQLVMSQVQTGIAPTANKVSVDLYVMESQ